MHGKTVRLSIDEGFKHAHERHHRLQRQPRSSPRSSSSSSVPGRCKGFAVTLIMGIVASMITAVFVTRTFFMIWLQRRPGADHAEHLT